MQYAISQFILRLSQLTLLSILVRLDVSTARSIEPVIINGSLAQTNQFPWHVSIIGTNLSGQKLLCGGSLIAREWVTTAAHCVVKRISLDLGLGVIDLTAPLIEYRNVTAYFIHEKYDNKLKHNDVALIRLPKPIVENESIGIIALPTSSTRGNTRESAFGTVAGFGRYIDDSQVVSRFLRWTRLQVITNDECTKTFGNQVVITSTLCAKSINESGQNVCNGDSGGALAVWKYNRPVLVGIIAFAAAGQCGGQYPSGFMRVQSHLQWLRNKMCSN